MTPMLAQQVPQLRGIRSHAGERSASRTGTMSCATPVETTCGGSSGCASDGIEPERGQHPLGSTSRPKVAGSWSIEARRESPPSADVDRLEPGPRLLDVACLRSPRACARRRPPSPATGGPRTAARRRSSRSGCGSRRPARSRSGRTSSPTAWSRARRRASSRRRGRRRRARPRARCRSADRREDVQPGQAVGAQPARSRSLAAASARTRAGRAPGVSWRNSGVSSSTSSLSARRRPARRPPRAAAPRPRRVRAAPAKRPSPLRR